MRRLKRLTALSVIVVASVAITALLGDRLGGLGVRQFESFTLDLRQPTTSESFQSGFGERESDIVLVLFDEFTVTDSIDGWAWISPFPRAHIAELIDGLSAAGARTIGLDVFLADMYVRLNQIDGGNDLLRDAMVRAGNVILAAPVEETDTGPVVVEPHPFFAAAAADIGAADLPSSFDTFREGSLAVRDGRRLSPSFALAMYAHARGVDVDSILRRAEDEGRVELPGLPGAFGDVPLGWLDGSDESDDYIIPFPIRYSGPPSSADAGAPAGTFQASASGTVSLMSMLTPELFADKIVLIGTGYHEEDQFRTPFFGYTLDEDSLGVQNDESSWMFGVEVHANALQNMLDGRYIRPLHPALVFLYLLLAAAAAGGMAFWRGAGWGGGVTATLVLGAWVIGFWSWAGQPMLPGSTITSTAGVGLWVPIVTPMLAAILSYVGSVAYVAIVEGREKRFLRDAFGRHLSPERVAEITDNPDALELGGEVRPVTLLFSDLAGFASISENMAPQELISLLNEYLEDMTQVVKDEMGYLDKYIGDAVMAFWNAPVDVEDHADRAMRAAVLMQRRLDALNHRWGAGMGYRDPLMVRIGVHSGEVVVGNVGGKDKIDYSVIGDAVNLAARLEPANKTYNTLNMVSEATLGLARQEYRVRELDYIAVKGKEEPVKVFELLELGGVELEEELEAALGHYDAGMIAYRKHDWETAKSHFEDGLARRPHDGPCALYAQRCVDHIADPPPPDWDFVVRRTEK
ncbi:MAG: adenylate/guanylate cyclase domain-containing protein [Gemmatimonadota bacterium]